LAEGISEGTSESFWLVCMNPKRRPICRIHLKDGPLVAASVGMREVFRVVLLTEARSIACLRTQGNVPVRPGAADRRLLFNLCATCRYMNVELADYLIARPDDREYYSWREHGSRAE
jgi:DNA repair protein RadC